MIVILPEIAVAQILEEGPPEQSPAPPAEAPAPVAVPPIVAPAPAPPIPVENWTIDFAFGSYGRAQVSFDALGNSGRNTNVVAHGPRIFEPSYAELDFSQTFTKSDGFDAKVLITLALFDPVAHYSGIFGDQGWAIRNLMVESGGFIPALPGLRLWAGSRMYRGDDIYLLDWWPLDNLNTIGGGASFEHKGFDLKIHAGVNRLDDSYQFQKIMVAGTGFGASEMIMLDRQRLIASLKTGYTFDLRGDLGVKLLLWAEYHSLPTGDRVPPELITDDTPIYDPTAISENLPADNGFVIGAQVGLFGFGKGSHVNLFFRYSRGIAAYGETGVPFGTTNDGKATGAQEVLGAISASWQTKWFGVLLGGYVRRFNDADVNRYDLDDYAEGALVNRWEFFITDHFHQGLELSYQKHVPFGLDPRTGSQEKPGVFQLTIMEIISFDRDIWSRPQIRFYYTLSVPNASARKLWPDGDHRKPGKIEHLVYLGAEWWFNSSTY